jgi:hypothetical protein
VAPLVVILSRAVSESLRGRARNANFPSHKPVPHRDTIRPHWRREKSETDTGNLDSRTPRPQNYPAQGGQSRQLTPCPSRSLGYARVSTNEGTLQRNAMRLSAGCPRVPDLFRQWLTDGKKKRPGPRESRGGCPSRRRPLSSPNSIGSPGPYPMLQNIAGVTTKISQEFRLPTGMTIRN